MGPISVGRPALSTGSVGVVDMAGSAGAGSAGVLLLYDDVPDGACLAGYEVVDDEARRVATTARSEPPNAVDTGE